MKATESRLAAGLQGSRTDPFIMRCIDADFQPLWAILTLTVQSIEQKFVDLKNDCSGSQDIFTPSMGKKTVKYLFHFPMSSFFLSSRSSYITV